MNHSGLGLFRWMWFGIFLLLPLFGQMPGDPNQRMVQIGIDRDNDPLTGCGWLLQNGSTIPGVDVLLTIAFQPGVNPQVLNASYQNCLMSGFGTPIPFPPAMWPLGIDTGLNGSDVLEARLPITPLGVTTLSRLYFQTKSGTGSFDVLTQTQASNPILYAFPIATPSLKAWALALLVMLFLTLGLFVIRKHRLAKASLGLFGLLLLGFASTIVLDGYVGDWAGVSALATDPAGDALGDDAIDILSVFACNDSTSLFFRVDLTNVENSPPTADPVTSSGNEDLIQTISLSGSDPEGDSISFAILTGPIHGSLGPITMLTTTTAEVVYTPNPDFFGSDHFTYQALDAISNSGPALADISVNPVNDSPTFIKGPNLTLIKDLGPQSIPGWASNISPGPLETGQVVSFTLNNDNNGLFSNQPILDAAGTLTFSTMADTNGVATITVVAMDDGAPPMAAWTLHHLKSSPSRSRV